ncbi:Pre-rRNA-processing protein esf1 [Amphibalanus amphitrite]|uniref:Pre-rRNA-processing protein esf1 n=1 Tax=Amphibalanus amphitrite TaxID=1232801 RepID=A0A6A4WEH0_AMPAM|nr:Pre-rRNA-processing protein esf1 [Amphibalanus amphitrite]
MDDQRFAHVGRDPKFRSMPRKYKKVKIDKRFDAMFKDKRFKLKYTVDKRGRPVNFSSSEDLKRYYEADEQSDGEDAEEEEEQEEEDTSEAEELEEAEVKDVKEEETKPVKKTKKDKKKSKPAEEPEDEEVGEEVRERLLDLAVDYARGGGVLMEDSSSDDESEPEEAELEHDWAELDREAPRISDDETTARLALCNMDWDRIKAQDIMVLMSSFLPPGGVISQVAIYPSEFGKKRMAEEEEHGPPELFDVKEKEDSDSSDEDDDERKDDGEPTALSQMEYVRRYQLSRLRYYYAVVSCDSRETAAKLYDECEGLEFESSASRVDLRFIPDDMTFDETPREVCTAVPEAGRYRPSQFVTTALQQRLVRFTWDETDADRQEVVRRAATAGDVDDADIRAYLADSSDEEQPGEMPGLIRY